MVVVRTQDGDAPQPPRIPIELVEDLPDFISRFHRFAKEGIADAYKGDLRNVVMFNLLPMDYENWPDLKEADRVWLVYRPGLWKGVL